MLLASIWCTTLNIILSEAIALTFSFKHKEETIEQFQHYFAFDEGRLIFTQVLLCLVLTVTVIAFAQLSYLCLWHINVCKSFLFFLPGWTWRRLFTVFYGEVYQQQQVYHLFIIMREII